MKNRDFLHIKGARENNLKNIELTIPKNKLVVFTGLSGSGKSSLAFNTIYEEGRRRYVDSLSSYARQFLGGTKKPDVDSIEGLSPAISIEQKTTHNNPRSTVGTVTEIHDYLRLLFARIGTPFCPTHEIEIKGKKNKEIIEEVFNFADKSRILVLAPLVDNAKGTHQNLLEKLKRETFVRVKIDDEILTLDEPINLDKNKKHTIDLVIDRIALNDEVRQHLADAIDLALEYGKGVVKIENFDTKEIKLFSKLHSCPFGDFEMPKIETKLFSFNAPYGMCETCKGLGAEMRADFDLLAPDKKLSINAGGIKLFENTVNSTNLEWQEFSALLKHYNIPTNIPISDYNTRELRIIKYGSEEDISFTLKSDSGQVYRRHKQIEGIIPKVERRWLDTTSEAVRKYHSKYMSEADCKTCNGARLNPYALAVKVGGYNIHDYSLMSIEDALNLIINLNLDGNNKEIAHLILQELITRLGFLVDVGLDYLSLIRKAETLSGGEAQRIRLATQIGSHLTGVLYVLDEPSIGLHQKDNLKLIKTLKSMVDLGNTLIVVEHDEDTMKVADYIVDIGPKAGKDGGQVVAAGTFEEICENENSITGQYLSKKLEIKTPTKRRYGNGQNINIKGARENNLKNLNVLIPLNKFVAVTGVSGSGKSTLINEIFVKGVQEILSRTQVKPGKHASITGLLFIDKIVEVSQSPIGRTPRSNPATYTGVFDDIRDLFSATEEARARGYSKGRFSFNVDGGRCDKCYGDGEIKIEMHFLPDVYVVCDHCDGARYNPETLEIKYRNKNISEVLNMTVSEALEFFENRPKVHEKLHTLYDVGLNYIKLGQSSTTLSGGEAQRIKLATHLIKKATGKTVYVLDEPTTGLHSYDVQKLLNILNRIVDNGDTVIVIEHNLDVIKSADHIIDLGPGGGVHGGKIVAQGTPEEVAQNPDSFTGQFIKELL
ncbi:excinuclease ABC subunit UvrA [Mycoplasmopsis agassizii]|uniref:UvrABC system protein A n=1 Tax=Mycoplasmopsis agassizii TaxID=33922 RepID=A0ABX4H4X0_9BACT|nr:excinuclease ABC subunit UvrA [Mycoplasmopsis agassizii]PAF54908.1 excinuclease ABC subunit UvrA [Mycoplasmopsis agassizii]SMC17209.1 Excinuclease ABC subunit A [Mycoplasmopsis agassizii]